MELPCIAIVVNKTFLVNESGNVILTVALQGTGGPGYFKNHQNSLSFSKFIFPFSSSLLISTLGGKC